MMMTDAQTYSGLSVFVPYLRQGAHAIPDVLVYLSVGLLAGSHEKSEADLAEIFREG